MKNLHKLTFTTAVLGVCLSSGVFAMESFEESEEMRNGGGTSAGQPRSSAAVAPSSAISSDAYTVPQIGDQSYEEWLERRVASLTTSEFFLGVSERDREKLIGSLLNSHIPSWQKSWKECGVSYLFYHPDMEGNSPTRFTKLKCFVAELAMLHFMRDSKDSEEGLFTDKETYIRAEGQKVATEIVKDLQGTLNEQMKLHRLAELRGKWGHKLPPMEGLVRGLNPESYRTCSGKWSLVLAAEHCRPALFQNKRWLQDLRTNEFFNVPNITSYDGHVLAIKLYNMFVEEELFEKYEAEEAAEKAEHEAREREARVTKEKALQEAREQVAREKAMREQEAALAARLRAEQEKASVSSVATSLSTGKKGKKK